MKRGRRTYISELVLRGIEIDIKEVEVGTLRKSEGDVKVNLAILVENDPKAPFSIATAPRCRRGRYSIPWIAPLYS